MADDVDKKRNRWLWSIGVISATFLLGSGLIVPKDNRMEWLSERLSDLGISGISLILGYYVVSVAFEKHQKDAFERKGLLIQLTDFFETNYFTGGNTQARQAEFNKIKINHNYDFRGIVIIDGVIKREPKNDFRGLNMNRINLSESRLAWAQFSKLKLDSSTSFKGAFLPDASFEECILDGVDFTETRLARASFRGATIKRVSFKEAFLIEADFRGAKIYLEELEIKDAQFGKRQSQLLGKDACAIYDESTEFWLPGNTDPEVFKAETDFGALIRRLLKNCK